MSFEKIDVATEKFKTFIGRGGYGWVYKGKLSIDGKYTTVAVKRLNEQFGQGLKEFLTEIQLLSGQEHPNLISLLGYCDEGKEKIIVYEYATRGSLDIYIRRNRDKNFTPLTWLERLKICADAARGLDHLHNHIGGHRTIIHRDIKSSNILIDRTEYYNKGNLVKIIDPSLREHMGSNSMTKFSEIAYRCLHDDREQRPSMDIVSNELEDALNVHVALAHELDENEEDIDEYWEKKLPDAYQRYIKMFKEGKKLGTDGLYEFTCRLESFMLSPDHYNYACYLVFKLEDGHVLSNDGPIFEARYNLDGNDFTIIPVTLKKPKEESGSSKRIDGGPG
ncbi:serine-threonine/tyrosine-protein kinase catalytic domain-containing protein [Tanacetum coccineum]